MATFQTAIFAMSARARAVRLDQSGTYHGGIKELHSDIDHTIVHSLGSNEVKVLRHVTTGGFWDEASRKHIKLSTGECPHWL